MTTPIDLNEFEETRHIDPPTCEDELAMARARISALQGELEQALTDESINSFCESFGGREIHRSWRDNMLKQAREVPEHRMNWVGLPVLDKQLDVSIAKDILFAFVNHLHTRQRGAKYLEAEKATELA